MDRLEILKKGREILSDASKWTKKQLARGKNNVPCNVNGGKALSYCMDGAIVRAGGGASLYGNGENYEARDVLSKIIRRDYPDRIKYLDAGGMLVVEFNDHDDTTYDEAVRVYEEAIKIEESRAG